ncbi:MAG: tetratricopeptide repeat protein [Pirellulales bacterium]
MTTISEALALGLAHHQARRWEQAESIYRQVLAQYPGHVDTLNCYAALVVDAGRRDEGIVLLEQAAAQAPHDLRVAINLGSIYVTTGRYGQAEEVLLRALQLDPQQPDATYHLGLVMEQAGRRDDAASYYRRTLQLQPQHRAAHVNLGVLLKSAGHYDMALMHFNEALAIDPESRYARYNRGMVLLTQGNFVEGFRDYEARLDFPEFGTRRRPEAEWDGRPLAAHSLIVYGEQGIGDMIQFVRYLPLVRQRCARVTLEVPQLLLPLFREAGIEGLAAQAPANQPPRAAEAAGYDFQIPLLSLPRVLGTTLATIPGGVPYLTANDHRVAQWRAQLAQYRGLRVGIAWQGRPTHRDDRYRSIPLARFAPLARAGGVNLLSLQKGHGREQLAGVGDQLNVVDLQELIDPQAEQFLDVAAIVRNLDLLITCDTSLGHLAGAMGVPVWVAIPAYSDWRWLLDRTDTPWYPTMRLFRQPELGAWEPVFAEMAAELNALVANRASTMKS